MTEGGEPVEVIHDQTIRIGELRIAAELGVAEDLGIALAVPVRAVESEIRYVDADGDAVAIAGDDIHHRNEMIWGIADPWLLAHRHLMLGRISLDVRAGLSLPLGATEENPFTAEAATRPHQHVQLGSGTFNPVLGVDLRWGLLGIHLLTQQLMYENDKGYMGGDRYVAGVSSALSWRGWLVEGGLDVQAETAERWDSVVHQDDGNQGRVDVLLGVGVARPLGRGLVARAGVKRPLYTHVVGGQLEVDLIIDVGISGSFELGEHDHGDEDEHDHGDEDEHDHGDEDEHDHDHGDDHDQPAPAGADIADAALAGEAVPLTPVAGKITVFDFWAPWCAPCHDLDRMLRTLAGRHPTRLAVRRINVVDWDSAAAARYLTPGGFNLPHLKVLAPDGRVLLERSAPPHDLVRDLEALLAE